jgi:hypothetical protein
VNESMCVRASVSGVMVGHACSRDASMCRQRHGSARRGVRPRVHARPRTRACARAPRVLLAIGILKALSRSTESAAPSTMMACTPCRAAMAAFHHQRFASALARSGELVQPVTCSVDETASEVARPLVSVATGFVILCGRGKIVRPFLKNTNGPRLGGVVRVYIGLEVYRGELSRPFLQ